MIVSCPSCGTSYKQPARPVRARAKCGCCAATVDLSALRPYRIVPVRAAGPHEVARAAAHLPIGLDEPALATRIADHVGDLPPAPLVPLLDAARVWDESEPLPEIPEMAGARTEFTDRSDGAEEAERAIAESVASPEGSPLAVYGFWAAGGAVIGIGTSWTIGGTTVMGLVAGGLTGFAAAWGFLRWTSRP